MHIQIIVGSTREGRASLPIARWVEDFAFARNDMTVELVDLKEWNLPFFAAERAPLFGNYEDELQKRWGACIERADGFVFIAPEYNHGYSAVLKNALDYLYAEWSRKPAAFIGFGDVCGARAIEQLRLVMLGLGMAPLGTALKLPDVRRRISAGRFDATTAEAQELTGLLDELSWWAMALTAKRKERIHA